MTRLVAWSLRRPRRVAAAALLLLTLAVVGVTRLGTTAAVRTIVGTGSEEYRAQRTVASAFGDDAIVVLIPASARQVAIGGDLPAVIGLEACLNGGAPASQALPGGKDGPCERLRRLRPAKAVYGPGSFVWAGAGALDDQIATLGRSVGPTPPVVTPANTAFVARFVFGTSTTGPPKQLFRPVFPTDDAGLIAVRLRSGLSEGARKEAVELVERAARLEDFALADGRPYVVSGTPVVVAAVADEVRSALLVLLGAGVLVMAAVLALTFPERRRLWPLGLALCTVLLVFGGIGLLGTSVTLGTLATLPVLLGLAVDYGVQLHARVEESRGRGLRGRDAVEDAAARGGRPVLLAAAATLAGFGALLASPTPLVRGFALALVAGVAIAVLAASTLGLVLHAREPRRGPAPPPEPLAEPPLAPGIGTGPVVRHLVTVAHGNPRTVLAAGALLAVAGVALGSGERVETDVQRLVPRDLPALQGARELERATGQSGEVQVLVSGDDLATPASLAWMDRARDGVLRRAGYDRTTGCVSVPVCPLGVPFRTLLGGRDASSFASSAAVRRELDGLPAYLVEGQLTADRRHALLSFGVPLGPLEQQGRRIDRIRSAFTGAPAGVRATVTGLPVLAADAADTISAPLRRVLALLGSLVLVGGALLLVTRSWARAVVPVIAVAFAAGWSGLVTRLLDLPLNPLSVVLGALVVAIGTEFAVLLTERYRQERRAGHPDAVAIARTAASTGRAVAASAATTVAGFAVLGVSDIPLLRQFGLLTVLDLALAVLAVVLVLPAIAGLAARRAPQPAMKEPR
jgi:uncharacterized protein